MSAAAFAFACYAPRRALLPIALTSGVATLLHTVVSDTGLGRTWAAAVGAFTIGLVAYAVAGPLPGAAAGRRGVVDRAAAARPRRSTAGSRCWPPAARAPRRASWR